MTCDAYCANNGCHGGPGCAAGAAKVAKIKVSRRADAADAGQFSDSDDLGLAAQLVIALVVVTLAFALAGVMVGFVL